jgi:hypothetical protein
MWSEETLRKMLPTNILLTTNITMSTRTQYHKIIKTMTEPLLQAYRAMLDIDIQATDRLNQQIQLTADINNNNNNNNNNNIELDPTTTINTSHASEVCKPNNKEAPSCFDAIDRIELKAIFIHFTALL